MDDEKVAVVVAEVEEEDEVVILKVVTSDFAQNLERNFNHDRNTWKHIIWELGPVSRKSQNFSRVLWVT